MPASSDLDSSAEVAPSIATHVTQKPHAASAQQAIHCCQISAILYAHRHTSMKLSHNSANRAHRIV